MEASDSTFNFLKFDVNLRDGQIQEIKIFLRDDQLIISTKIDCRDKQLHIEYLDVTEYAFYHNRFHIFYNIEDFKLLHLKAEGEYYVSFDPDLEVFGVSEKDNDFIKCKGMSVLK